MTRAKKFLELYAKGGFAIGNDNYFCYHIHSDLSNAVTNIDSVTKYEDYVRHAAECGMTTFGFSEHGSIMGWFQKKQAIEAAGMKYVHGVECYLTETLEYKERDNYHCVLLARNYDGFLELNRLVSASFNRKDNHFYYVPRISFDELFNTTDHILITTACVGGVLGKGEWEPQDKFLRFLEREKHRSFLEIGHHKDPKQIAYNKKIVSLSERTGIPLIAGTDTHALNADHEKGRSVLQQAKKICFEGEENLDLKFKTYPELVQAYREQGCLKETVFLQAIENTNMLADMVEPFTVDCGTKYPHIYDNPEQTFRKMVYDAIDTHPYALKNHSREELESVVEEELSVYERTHSVDFMLMQTYLRQWERSHGIQCGYGRGSISGSMVAYLLGITQMDSLRFDLNFFRFINPDRVTNADIDSDYAGVDRDKVKEFLLRDKIGLPQIKTAEIITFNTIAAKGAVRDICRALYKDRQDINYMNLSDEISKMLDKDEEEARKRWPEVFRYVDLVSGTIVSVGTHPSGVLISDLPIEETIGLCSVSSSDYPVSMVNMKELDTLFYVKLDILGLDNIGVINDTCKLAGIERLTPDNVDLEDEKVWNAIRADTTLIFQWESDMARQYMRRLFSDKVIAIAREKIPHFSMLKWLSFGNGLLRPACASFRDSVAKGEFYDNGLDALNELLAPEAGRIAMQETIMRFLVQFCGYSNAESDTVRRAIAKKKGTETLLPEIGRRFTEYCMREYGLSEERCTEIIEPFLQIILDASAYGFSWNHSDAYSAIGYICGYLRTYYPFEFLTAALNIFSDDTDKTAEIIKYANSQKIIIANPKWGISKSDYYFDRERGIIAKGVSSIKYMSERLAAEMYDLSQQKHYDYFVDLLSDLNEKTCANTRQIDILIKLDFFSDFGNQRELLRLTELFFGRMKAGRAKQIRKEDIVNTDFEKIVAKHSVGTTKNGAESKSYQLLDVPAILRECERVIKDAHCSDLPDILKVRNFYDAMGYVGYISGKPEDRRKLYVIQNKELHRRKDGKLFGHSVLAKSIGSGIENWFTIFDEVYRKDPVPEGSILYCKGYKFDRGYHIITEYTRLS